MKLTPTEELVLEVLAARARLGENLWTFSTSSLPAARGLRDKGLINLMSGVVEKTYRASLTTDGRDYTLSAKYTPPILKKYKLKKRYRS